LDAGEDVRSLVAAVPTVAHWRLAGLPSRLTAEEVRAFLSSFDRSTAPGLRGFAIARCLADLGLRANEVAGLELGDLDWSQGTVTIRGGKLRRADVLPLPEATGQAIVEYLRRGRPACTSRALFVRHRAPLHGPITPSIVRCTVRMGFSRAGLAGRYSGTHVLRRTAATQMLCAGASLKDIADVLRHRSLDTTQTYTKVDLPRLAALAVPWPGRLA
jgi:site-specific recombinase XerD